MTTWVPVNDNQGSTWEDTEFLGSLLLETGPGNYLTQETGTAPTNRFTIYSPLPDIPWSNVNDNQGAGWGTVVEDGLLLIDALGNLLDLEIASTPPNNLIVIPPTGASAWTNIDDSQGASWQDLTDNGFLLVNGTNNYLIQNTTSAPYNRIIINTPG